MVSRDETKEVRKENKRRKEGSRDFHIKISNNSLSELRTTPWVYSQEWGSNLDQG